MHVCRYVRIPEFPDALSTAAGDAGCVIATAVIAAGSFSPSAYLVDTGTIISFASASGRANLFPLGRLHNRPEGVGIDPMGQLGKQIPLAS